MPFEVITTVRRTRNTHDSESFVAISTRRHYVFGIRRQKDGSSRTILREESWPKSVRDAIDTIQTLSAGKGRPLKQDGFVIYLAEASEPIHIDQAGLMLDIYYAEPGERLTRRGHVVMDGRILEFRTG